MHVCWKRLSAGLKIRSGPRDPKVPPGQPYPIWPSPPILEDKGLVSGRAWESALQFAMFAWAPYRGIFLIHRSIAYAHRYGGACNSRGVLRGRGSGLCTTNMARSITEARLPREIAQSCQRRSRSLIPRERRAGSCPPRRIFIAFTHPSPAISSRSFHEFSISDLPPVHSSLSCNNL